MAPSQIDFDGRPVLVTGAATRIGPATVLAYAAAGASVVIDDVDPRADATVRDILAAGGKAVFQKTNVSDSAAFAAELNKQWPVSLRPTGSAAQASVQPALMRNNAAGL